MNPTFHQTPFNPSEHPHEKKTAKPRDRYFATDDEKYFSLEKSGAINRVLYRSKSGTEVTQEIEPAELKRQKILMEIEPTSLPTTWDPTKPRR